MTTTVILAQKADEVDQLTEAISRGTWTQSEPTSEALASAIAALEEHADGTSNQLDPTQAIEGYANDPENQKPTSELTTENDANQHPDNSSAKQEHTKPTKAQARQRNRSRVTLTPYYLEAKMMRRSIVDQYAGMSSRQRQRVKKIALKGKNLAKAQFTPEETREMLRIFILLDRLVDPSKTLAEARKQADQGFNAPQDAEVLMEMRDGQRRTAQLSAVDQEKYNEWKKRLGRTPDDEANTIDFTKLENYLQKQFARALSKRREQSARNGNLIFSYRNEFGIVPQMFESENPFEQLTEPHQIAKMLEQHGAKRNSMMGKIVGITRNMRKIFHHKLKQADELTRPQKPQDPHVRRMGELPASEAYAQRARRSIERVR